jgi:hypothetical protein
MLGTRILLEPLGWNPSRRLAVVYRGKALRGVVKAVGSGRYPKIYNGRKGQRTEYRYSKHFLPTTVRVGDVVELGGLEIRGYLFPTLHVGGVEHVICDEQDVAAVYV